jgi:serine/threonine protein kinase
MTPFAEEFFNQFKERYTYVSDLGEGSYSETFLATDIYRNIKVCIKIFKNGVTPIGANRDWRITSTIKHRQIADTFTIEKYTSVNLGTDCKAVIARYMNGVNLEKLLNEIESLEITIQEQLKTRLLSEFFPSLIDALIICHDYGFGHSDLSERNIIVDGTVELAQTNLNASLIDFDNATNKTELYNRSEQDKKQSDLRALTRLLGFIANERRWYSILKSLLEQATDIHEYSIAYKTFIEFSGNLLDSDVSNYSDTKFLKFHTNNFAASMNCNKFGFKIRKAIEHLSTELGIQERNSQALDNYIEHLRSGSAITSTVTMYEITSGEEQFLKRLFK